MVPAFTITNPDEYLFLPSQSNIGTVNVTTEAIRITSQCPPSKGVTFSPSATNGTYFINGTLSSTCSAWSSGLDSTRNGQSWFGWANPAPPACVTAINPNATAAPANLETDRQPVIFSFYKNMTAYTSTFCYAQLDQFSVGAVLDLTSSRLQSVSPLNFTKALGFGWNGLDYSGDSDDITRGIMDAVRYALGEGIVNAAGKMAGWGAGINSALQDAQLSDVVEATKITQRTFLLYNIMSATTLYVNGGQLKTVGTYSYQGFRLVPNAIVAHSLAILTSLTGAALLILFLSHRWSRRDVKLRMEPVGSIASVAALLSRSQFIKDLDPMDTKKTVEKKLENLRFRLDPDTGGIEGSRVDEDDDGDGEEDRMSERSIDHK